MKLLAAVLLAVSLPVSAGKMPKQVPDDYSNAGEHAMFHAVAGIGVVNVLPRLHPAWQWGVCQIPGAMHELVPGFGRSRSNRDLLVNAAGCAFGVAAGHGFWVAPTNGGAMIYKSWELK